MQEKRVAASNCEINNNNINNDDGVDMISKLSDDILLSIISRLTVAEAVCTSILSTRWRGLHKYITRLDFSPTSKQLQAFKEEEEFRLHKVGHDNRLFEEELIRKCTSVIDRTLDSNNGGSILEEIRFYLPWFQITTCLNESWPIESGLVERWLDFAFSKQVQTIHLHINTFHLRVPFSYSNFTSINKTLKEISLNGIDLDDEGLRLLLSNFVALERLSIERSDKLSDVHILGDHLIAPKLKHLNISACWDIKFIEIRDMTNFESLRLYHLPLIGYELVLENLPRFVQLDTNCRKTEIEILSRGNVISEQLVKLKLSTYIFDVYNDYMPLARMGKLKHVELEFSIYTDRSFHELVRFMDACPCLQKLEIKMKSRWGGEHYCMEVVKKGSNDHLKWVKLSGLEGCSCEMKFGSYIVGKATELKELVMEICPEKTDESRRRARALVRKCFQPILPDSVNFVIV
ncbi:PREDICTED: F-box/FBD/LRR-repeat protein At5g53840-like [Erythranthe guttata]|nr:PREDICTED: F-box/FBD/LRR-repeat protein At5g53840-like [Erythranthe guttata]|eukprot:XP_012837993.1 PREDICTED: F-box/FBD/LRR-repeat protein At5g53840-like [Erythranthe guttata]